MARIPAALKPSAYIAANEWETATETNPTPLDVEECIIGFETVDQSNGRMHTIVFTAWQNGEITTTAKIVPQAKYIEVKAAIGALWNAGKAKTRDFGKHYQTRLADVVAALTH